MTRIILYEILRVVILNLLYTSMYSDGSSLYPEFNPLVGEPFNLVCRTEATITSTVAIRFPNGITAGYCDPPSDLIPVDCGGFGDYSSALNETENTVTISTNSLASDVNGTWTCTDSADTFSYNLVAPIREIRGMTFNLFPTSFTANITSETTSISLSATYECINLPVHFKWFVVDSASKKIDISGTSNVAENSSLCTSGFSGYTETKEVNEDVYSSSPVTKLQGSYRLGVEVHYMDEVTTLHSIKYFDTYFVFSSGGTNGSTDNDNDNGQAIGILNGCLGIAYIIVIALVAIRLSIGSTGNTSGNCFLTFCLFIDKKLFDCCGRESSQEGVLTLNSLLGFTYLVLYGVIVEVIVLLAVYYGYSKFQEGLVIGVGFVIVLVLSGLCLLVVWMLMKYVYNDASETSRSPSCISLKNGTVTPHERQQPDGDEGIQSTPTEIHTRLSTTPRPLPPRPDIASKPQGTLDSLNSHIPIVLAPIYPNIPPSIDTLDEQKTDKKPKYKKKKKKKKKDVEQDNPGTGQ